VIALEVLALHILLLRDEDRRGFVHAIGVGAAVVLLEVGGLVQVVQDGLNGG
jgi:hypothetical protein